MKITVLPERLKAALDIARKPVKHNASIVSVTQVCLRATDDGSLALSGTDLRWYATASLTAKVTHSGAVTLAPKALSDVLAACQDGEPLTIDVTDTHRATLTCGRATIRLVGGDAEEFPPAPVLKAGDRLSLSATLLRELIETTAFAAARDESRPVLSGVLLSVKDNTLTLAAADGFRLAVHSAALAPGAPDLSVIVPAGALREIVGALPKTDDIVTIATDESHTQIESSSGTWTLTQIEGPFPDFNRIIPREAVTQITCNRADLERAVTLALSFQDEVTENGKRYSTCIARLSVEDDGLTIRSRSDQGDQEGALVIPIEIEGDPLAIGFNGLYLRDAVHALTTERVSLDLIGPASPAVLHTAGPRNGHLQICMPMHVAR